jgi:hypothetical protein
MILLHSKRIMTSWANLKSVPSKKLEPTIRSYFSSTTNEYPTSTLDFLYSYIYQQRNAEPFYIHDTEGFFQPLLKTNPALHYLREAPSTGNNLATDISQTASILNAMSLSSMKRTASDILQLNSQAFSRVETALSNAGLVKQTFDVGIVLDISGCVPLVIAGLKALQKRTGKKTMRVFVMTESIDYLREFSMKGDPSWTFASMMRQNAPTDKEYRLVKTLAEIKTMQGIEHLAFRFSSPLGKLLYLTSSKINTESQVISIDGAKWKAV